jgi:hypothetical protein
MEKHNGVALLYYKETNFCRIQPVNAEHTLEGLYKLLDCEAVEAVHMNIAGKNYTVYLDEEGKFKEPWAPTGVLYDNAGNIADILAGSLLVVCQEYDKETFEELSEQECDAIVKHLRNGFSVAQKEVQRLAEEKL